MQTRGGDRTHEGIARLLNAYEVTPTTEQSQVQGEGQTTFPDSLLTFFCTFLGSSHHEDDSSTPVSL